MLGLSVIYPFLDFSTWFIHNKSVTEAATVYAQYLPEFTISQPVHSTASTISLIDFVWWSYAIITCFFLVRLSIRTLQIIWIKQHTTQTDIENYPVRVLCTQTMPFSFFNWVFINPGMHNTTEIHEIITHELIHVRQKHSIDIIFSEIICAFCWFNPMVWMLKKEIHQNLEFIVDQQVVKTGIDIKSYQYHLLRLAYHPNKSTIANQFNVSPLKTRIIMLNTKQSPKIKLIAYTLFIPLVLLFVFVNNAGAIISNVTNNGELKSVMEKISGIVPLNDTHLPLNIQPSPSSIQPSPTLQSPPTHTTLQPKDFEIQGILVDKESNKPLAGVNVIIWGTSTGTISNIDGSFRLKIHEGDSILFSHIGYTGLAYAAKNKNNDIGTLQMKRKREELDEVIVVGYGMSENPFPGINNQPRQTIFGEDEVFMVVEEMPEFPGGQSELMNFIAKTIRYPVEAQENGIQGRIICSFIVDASGSIVNAKIARGVDPSLDSEALRIIYSMPKWKPGRQRGKAVPVEYTVPINFRLQQ
jgi:TonB family protein